MLKVIISMSKTMIFFLSYLIEEKRKKRVLESIHTEV